ncbi:putative calcium-transporting ATPase 7, plasma membrane-type [Capsicum chinense]|nr:putative calcium-transporting ATPase 7, plasma membrane-type [Capsicum chinense]
MLIVLAAVYDLEMYQMDVKTTFLNGELEKKIYMEQPKDFVVPGKENKDTLSKAVDLLPELCKLADAPREAIISYRRPLLHQWNLDIQTTTRIQRDLPSFFSIVELNHSIFNNTGGEVVASKHGKPDILGTPIETASLQFGLALGGDLPAEQQAGKLIKVEPFNYTNKCMGAVLDLAEGGLRAHTKGASEIILAACDELINSSGEVVPLDETSTNHLNTTIDQLANEPLRTLCL